MGVILYVLLAGYLPFDEHTMAALFTKIKVADYEFPDWFSPEARDMLQMILVTDPRERVKLSDIKAHKWFNQGASMAPPSPTGSAAPNPLNKIGSLSKKQSLPQAPAKEPKPAPVPEPAQASSEQKDCEPTNGAGEDPSAPSPVTTSDETTPPPTEVITPPKPPKTSTSAQQPPFDINSPKAVVAKADDAPLAIKTDSPMQLAPASPAPAPAPALPVRADGGCNCTVM